MFFEAFGEHLQKWFQNYIQSILYKVDAVVVYSWDHENKITKKTHIIIFDFKIYDNSYK